MDWTRRLRSNANNELGNDLLKALFSSVDRYQWDAFHVYEPPVSQPPFRLTDGVCYTNAMESVMSTMETKIASARNVAALIDADLGS